MNEKNLQIINDLEDTRKRIIEHLEEAVLLLEDVGKKSEGHELWYLIPGTPGNRISEMIQHLREIVKEVISVVPKTKQNA